MHVISLRFVTFAVAVVPLLPPISGTCCAGDSQPAKDRASLEDRDAKRAEVASIAGTWTSVRFHNIMPTEWGAVTGCELTIRKFDPEKDEVAPFREGEWTVTLHLFNPKKRWRAPDSSPGWFDRKGTLWMGPIGSALRFELLSAKEDRLILKHEKYQKYGNGTILLERKAAAKQEGRQKGPTKTDVAK
jgi:hypothetical protein